MYTKMNYLKDVGRFLRTGDPAWLGEWWYVLKQWRHSWRCWIGWHWSTYHEIWYGYYEPPEYGYECEMCGKEVYPPRIRLSIWFWETQFFGKESLGELMVRYDMWRHPERYEE